MGFVFAYSLNTYLYHPQIMKACYHQTNDSTFEYDGQMVDDYQKKQEKADRRLVLFHLLGQHVGFEHRYPESFAHFTPDSLSFRKESWLTDEMREEIAHYDNATLYNDYVIKQIINLYNQQNTIVVYLADHGEEVYDYRDNLGRDDWNMGSDPVEVLRWQYMVPIPTGWICYERLQVALRCSTMSANSYSIFQDFRRPITIKIAMCSLPTTSVRRESSTRTSTAIVCSN